MYIDSQGVGDPDGGAKGGGVHFWLQEKHERRGFIVNASKPSPLT